MNLIIQSHKGPYEVIAAPGLIDEIRSWDHSKNFFIIDRKVAQLYDQKLKPILDNGRFLLIEANENSKTLDRMTGHIENLVSLGIRRGTKCIAIGGGVIQDITCFIAATLFRGLEWEFFPTTLLAQADSCIGSKSSINVGHIKNLVGTFTPPKKVYIDSDFLKTLTNIEILSGIGEILKINIICGPQYFQKIADTYDQLLSDSQFRLEATFQALKLKKTFIEQDEFDIGIRNILNYGHSFGHAIESASDHQIPHGIAISLGMDLANLVSTKLGFCDLTHFENMHRILKKNHAGFGLAPSKLEAFFTSLMKDKKNYQTELGLILLNTQGIPEKRRLARTAEFDRICIEFFNTFTQ